MAFGGGGSVILLLRTEHNQPSRGYYDLDDKGRPTAPGYGAAVKPARYLFATSRVTHAYAIAHLMGRPGADFIIDHGMNFLWNGHRDPEHGGYYWGVGYDGPSDSTKQAYGHAFVLLAASSAKVAGHPGADRLLDDVLSRLIRERFWEEQFGAVAEEFTRDWRSYNSYRGQKFEHASDRVANGRVRGNPPIPHL